MKKNGFTMVELIGVIVILGIIATLGVGAYGTISKRVKETAYLNKKAYIENGASRYASETGFLITNVDELVKAGYIEADNKNGEVINPIDKSVLNCRIVTIREENSNFYGELSEAEECDLGNIEVVNVNLEIKEYEKEATGPGKELTEGEWTGKDVILEIKFKKTSINENEIRKIVWKSGSGTEEIDVTSFSNQKTKEVTAEQIMNTNYEVEVIMSDGTKYQARRRVKIDKQRPIIYIDETEIENESIYVNKDKIVTVKGSDLNGSGISGYYIGSNKNCREVEYEKTESGSYQKELDNGTYYVCLQDKVGNISEDESSKTVTVNRVDKIAPTCVWSGENSNWTKDNVTINLKGVDNESGTSSTKSWSYTTGTHKTEKLSYEIKDEAGNTTLCEKEASVYVDTEAPECKWEGDSTTWTNKDKTITLKGNDLGIGSTSSHSWTYNEGTVKTDNLSYEVTDNLGNSQVCSKEVGVYLDKEPPNCVWSGDNYTRTWTKNNVYVFMNGFDSGSGIDMRYANRIWSFVSGTHEVEKLSSEVRDLAGNQITCTQYVNIYVDKEPPSCNISVTGTKGSNDWYTSNVNFKLETSDSGSGLNYQYISSNSLATNVNSYNVSAVVKDKLGNEQSCDVTVKRDANAPSLTPTASKNYIKENQSSAISNYYKLNYSISGGTLTCDKNNINELPFGASSVNCTATGGNGLVTNLTLAFGHEYTGTASGCSNGGTYQNGTCHFNNNGSICGNDCNTVCKTDECKTGNPYEPVYENRCVEYYCTLYKKCNVYSVTGYCTQRGEHKSTCYSGTTTNPNDCNNNCQNACTHNSAAGYSHSCIVSPADYGRHSLCGTENITETTLSQCANANYTCKTERVQVGTKNTCQKGETCNQVCTAKSCDNSGYITYSCPRGGTANGSTCRF